MPDPGEQCDSAAAFANNTCDPNTCQIIPTVCGNNLVQPGEQCDSAAGFANHTCAPNGGITVQNVPGPGTHVIAGCQTIPAVCGDGLVEGNEQCDAGPSGSSSCTTSCTTISPCLICETTGAACAGVNATLTAPFGCIGLSGTQAQTDCNNLKNCMETHPNCSNPMNVSPPNADPTGCFCGALDSGTCSASLPSAIVGPCADAYFKIYGSTQPGHTDATAAMRDAIFGDFFAKATAVGMANDLYACDVQKGCFTAPAQCP
jgi:hypothetical protein